MPRRNAHTATAASSSKIPSTGSAFGPRSSPPYPPRRRWGSPSPPRPPVPGRSVLVEPCVTYPYTDGAAFVPTDYYWIYPAFLMGPLFLMLVGCIHARAAADKRVFSRLALAFATISAGALATNYYIQLTVMQPSFLNGETEGLSLFSQYNPHGVFIALEDLGYLMMSVAGLFAAAVFDRRTGLDRTVRIILVVSAVLSIGALILLAAIYGYDLEYRYEVASLLINWADADRLGDTAESLLPTRARRLKCGRAV